MIKRTIIIILIALLICGGLYYVLYLGGANSFKELLDNLLNDYYKEEDIAVEVYVFETSEAGEKNFASELDVSLRVALENYFSEYNRAWGASAQDLTPFEALYKNSSKDKEFDALILRNLIKGNFIRGRERSEIPVAFSQCEVELRLNSIVYADEGLAEVYVEEGFSAVFNGFTERSSYTGVKHFFVMDKSVGGWLIERHETNASYSVYVNGELNKLIASENMSRESLDVLAINEYVARLGSLLNGNQRFVEAEEIEDVRELTPIYAYNAKKAVEYALRYANERNPEFVSYERNSSNFVSQCLNAGGVPMQGAWAKDKPAFINASAFYDYTTSGSSFISAGLVDFKDGQVGDIAQFLDGGGQAVFSALVTGRENGDLLFTSNDQNFKMFPVSAIGFDKGRVVRVYGYS